MRYRYSAVNFLQIITIDTHSSPVRARYGVSVVILIYRAKLYRVITALDCMHMGWLFCSILSVNSHDITTHITQGYFTGIMSFAWLPYYQHNISAISVKSTDIKSQHCAVVNNAHGWYFVLYWHHIGQHIIMWDQELQTVWNIITHIYHSNSMIGSLIFSLNEYFNAHTHTGKAGFCFFIYCALLWCAHGIDYIIARWLYTSLSLLCRTILRHWTAKMLVKYILSRMYVQA